MSYFNDENESVRDTLNRVMTDMGYFDNPMTINTQVGNRTFYEPTTWVKLIQRTYCFSNC